MPLDAENGHFMFSGASVVNASQTDPTLSFGGNRADGSLASNRPYRQEALDTAQTSETRSRLQDDETIGDTEPDSGWYLQIVGGAAAGHVAQVESANFTTGEIILKTPTPANVAIGDNFRFAQPGDLFPSVSAADALAGRVDYRMLYFVNNFGEGHEDLKFWIDPIETGGCSLEVIAADVNLNTVNLPATDITSPVNPLGILDPYNVAFNDSEGFTFKHKSEHATPRQAGGFIIDGNTIPVWLRRTIPANSQSRLCCFALNCVSAEGGGDPDPFTTGFPIVWEIDAQPRTITLSVDRIVREGGGARLTGTLTNGSGSPLEGRNVRFTLQSGNGSVSHAADLFTDALGEAKATFTAPTTGGDQTSDVRMHVPGGDEF